MYYYFSQSIFWKPLVLYIFIQKDFLQNLWKGEEKFSFLKIALREEAKFLIN